jgi:hypothetical protein
MVGLPHAAAAGPWPAYSITNIGALAPGQSSNATALNGLGDVVGQVETTNPAYGFLYRRGRMEKLVPPAGFSYCLPVGISDRDVIIATATREDGSSTGFAIRPNGTSFVWTQLPLGATNQTSPMPVSVDSAGDIAGNIWLNDGSALSPIRSVVWRPKKKGSYANPDLLPLSRGFTISVAGAISIVNRRVMVAGAQGNGVDQQASVWSPSGHLTPIVGALPYVTGLGVRGNTVFAAGIAWHGDGSIAWSEKIDAKSGGSAAGVTFLNPPRGYDYSEAGGVAVSPAGSTTVVGDIQARSQFLPRAAIWTHSGVHLLQTLLAAGSGWTLSDAAAINSRGQIVGFGTVRQRDQAYILTPR